MVAQLDELPSLNGVRLIVTLNVCNEPFAFESRPLRHLQLVVIRNSSPMGFGANHNQAFERCETSWFAILNPDLSITADVFTSLIDIANKKMAALIVPQIFNSTGFREDSVRWNLTPWSLVKRRLGVKGEDDIDDGRFRWFAGMFYLVQSAAYRKIGGFNTHYFLYCEDYDLCARMHLAGQSLWLCREIQIIHDARRASWKSRHYLMMHLKSLIRVWTSVPLWRIALRDLSATRRPRQITPCP
ncbi:MAG: glycosyltransferase family 2 protein [Rhizobacter sp.]|nr:glycosyltransferase family 2 protein [Burkholderiales bacterium]